MNSKFVPRKKVLETLGISKNTFYELVKNNKFEFIKLKKKKLYNIEKFLNKTKDNETFKRNICYCRVSSRKQKSDLERQIKLMKKIYPNYEIITDIASSLNFKRKGLIKIIDMSIKGNLNELVIMHKDRLARIGFELISILIEKYSNGKIIIINNDNNNNVFDEITKDIIAIMNIYVAKVNGLRKYKINDNL